MSELFLFRVSLSRGISGDPAHSTPPFDSGLAFFQETMDDITGNHHLHPPPSGYVCALRHAPLGHQLPEESKKRKEDLAWLTVLKVLVHGHLVLR